MEVIPISYVAKQGGYRGGLAVTLEIEIHLILVKFDHTCKYARVRQWKSSKFSRFPCKGAMGSGSPTPKIELHSNTSDFGENWTI